MTALEVLALLLLLPALALAEAPRSIVKMQRSNPVVSAIVDGVALDLVLTTDVDGAWVCLDLDTTKRVSSMAVDFDYARKLLRRQLQMLERHSTRRVVHVPAWGRSQSTSVAYFGLGEQSVSASAVEFFLLGANATGFLGIGLATKPRESLLWSLLKSDCYSYTGMAGGGNHSANVTVETASVSDVGKGLPTGRRQWSEPAGPPMAEATANHQDISFPIHNLRFRCRKPETESPASEETDESSEDDEAADGEEDGELYEAPAARWRTVDVFGGVTGNWDAVVDLNSPCLVLPTEFYSALTGWIGVTYNERMRVSELPAASSQPPLPVLYFSLSYGSRPVALPLDALVLPELQLNASTTSDASSSSSVQQTTRRRLCLQRSGSIVHNGATIFATLESDAATVQRYRMQGSLSLPLFNMVQAPVVLGAMAIEAIGGISVNGANRSSALAVRSTAGLAADDAAAAVCAAERSACVGEQQYVESTNTCQDPDCSRYYFHSLDDDTKRCAIDPAWLTALAVTSTAFAAAELFFSTSMRRLVRGAMLEATAS